MTSINKAKHKNEIPSQEISVQEICLSVEKRQ